jgi:hypothetical protein
VGAHFQSASEGGDDTCCVRHGRICTVVWYGLQTEFSY